MCLRKDESLSSNPQPLQNTHIYACTHIQWNKKVMLDKTKKTTWADSLAWWLNLCCSLYYHRAGVLSYKLSNFFSIAENTICMKATSKTIEDGEVKVRISLSNKKKEKSKLKQKVNIKNFIKPSWDRFILGEKIIE